MKSSVLKHGVERSVNKIGGATALTQLVVF